MELFEYIDIMNQPYDIFYTDNVHSPLHWHYYSEILYILSGSMRIICNNKVTLLHKGDICYFYPLQLHGVEPDKANQPYHKNMGSVQPLACLYS